MSTGDGALDLVAHVYRQALKDARRGHTDAIYFLDSTAPDWRQYLAGQATKRPRLNETGHQGQNRTRTPRKIKWRASCAVGFNNS